MLKLLSFSGKTLLCLILASALFFAHGEVSAVEVITDVADDPYFQMNGSNLNTMNSYIIPTQNDINPETYSQDSEWKYVLTDEGTLELDTTSGFKMIHIMSTYPGYIIMWGILVLIRYLGVKNPESGFGQTIRLLFEGVRGFFEDILGKERKHWIKVYVVSLFFVILISNLFGLVNDMIRFAFPQYLRRVTAPTGEFESTIAFALIATFLTLYVQARAVGGPHRLILEYIPITGKGLVDGKGFLAKIGDIIISMFIGFLDIVGVIAKVISLSIRLFGNMSSGSILLNVIFIGVGLGTVGQIGFNVPLGLPIIIYIQGLLSSVIQAFVFALLVGIGITMVDE